MVMILAKSDVKALVAIFKGASSRESLAKHLRVSVNRVSVLLEHLKNLDFIEIMKKNRRLIVKPSKTQHAHLFKKLLILEPGTKYEEFLFGLNFRLLSYCLYSWKPMKNITEALGIAEKTVLNRSMYLRSRLLLTKEKKMLKFNSKSWSNLYWFLSAFRNYTTQFSNVLWKFEDEIVFEAAKEDIQGVLTGFSVYPSYKVPMYVIKHACYLPIKKLSKEEVFIHSLLQVRNETRLLELAFVFYYKNNLNNKKLINLAYKYDCIDMLNDFFIVLKAKDEKIKTTTLPPASRQGIKEMLKTYGAT